jgi:hypothetical protein
MSAGNPARWELDIEDLLNAGAAAVGKFRRVHWTDPDGVKWRAYGLFTAKVSDETSDEHDDVNNDLYFGGSGGGSVQLMTLVSFSFNTLVCRPAGGASDGSEDVDVALEPQLRSGITSQDIPTETGTETWTYSSYNATYQSRTASGPSGTEVEHITPRFIVGDTIPVWSCSSSGITNVTRIAVTGRQWAAPTV